MFQKLNEVIYYIKRNCFTITTYIDDTPGITVQQIQSKLYKLKRDHDVKFCVVDYLQLISSTNSTGDRQMKYQNISRQLKELQEN
nr:DnaB-like helicase C-terminal domain-containing protein [Entomoplasma sp. MP1]